MRHESVLSILFRSNPEWCRLLMDGLFHDLGNGLQVQMTHYLLITQDWTTKENRPIDCLSFSFVLEGVDIGSLCEDYGGFIHFSGKSGDELTDQEQDEIGDHMDKIISRMDEIFPHFNYEQENRRSGSGPWPWRPTTWTTGNLSDLGICPDEKDLDQGISSNLKE